MGLQIPHGWRLAEDIHPGRFAQRLRDVLRPISEAKVAQFVVDAAVWSIDATLIGQARPPAGRQPLLWANDQAHTQWQDHGSFDCTVVLLCDLDGDGRWYAVGSSSDEDLTAAIDAMEETEDHHYFSTADQGEGTTREQWRRRGEVWSRLTSHGSLAGDGLVVQLWPDGPPAKLAAKELGALIGSRHQRARRLVTQQLVVAHCGENANARTILRSLRAAAAPGATEQLDRLAAQVTGRLVDLDGERLWGTMEEILGPEGGT